MENNIIRVAGIVSESIVDGPGLRFALFVQGCPHDCEGCQNPQTHDFSGGTPMSVAEIFDMIKKDPLVKGVTLSGGEPFSQPAPLAMLAQLCKKSGLEVAAYSGYTFEELFEMSKSDSDLKDLLSCCDTIIDGRFVLAQRTLSMRFRGSKNQRTIDVQKSLSEGHAVLDTSERWNG